MRFLTLLTGAAAFAFASSFSAQAEERVLEITGVVEYLPSPYDAISAEEAITFKAHIFERTQATEREYETPFVDLSYGYSVTQVSIDVLDAQGETIFSDTLGFEFPRNTTEGEATPDYDYTYSMFSKVSHDSFWGHQHATWSGTHNASPRQARHVELGLSFLTRLITEDDYYQPSVAYAENIPLFVEDSLFPTFIEGDLVYPFRYHFSNNVTDELIDLRDGIFGYATHVRYVVLDADGDGFLDVDDNCVTSLADDFVTLNGQLLTVVNVVDAQGCTVMDHYAACEAEQGDGGFLGYSGASYCEQQVAYQLYREGLIDYSDVRELRSALR